MFGIFRRDALAYGASIVTFAALMYIVVLGGSAVTVAPPAAGPTAQLSATAH